MPLGKTHPTPCPECGGELWDNRGNKKNPKAPDAKCKDKSCEGVIWPNETVETHFAKPKLGEPPPTTVAAITPRANVSALDERQRAIIRQHSQSMSLEVLKLKAILNELTIVDLTPSKLRDLANYFDADVIRAAE